MAICVGGLLLFLQGNPKCCPFANDRGFHENLAFVVVLDDALGQGKAETPAAFLAREARVEHLVDLRLRNALTRVAQVEVDVIAVVDEVESDFAVVAHGIDGVFG